eukprot:2563385-Rhodomonas_salina.1
MRGSSSCRGLSRMATDSRVVGIRVARAIRGNPTLQSHSPEQSATFYFFFPTKYRSLLTLEVHCANRVRTRETGTRTEGVGKPEQRASNRPWLRT